ncbi:MAG: hypothetical protein WD645_00205, partial [Dehalococcoidia bacterium]
PKAKQAAPARGSGTLAESVFRNAEHDALDEHALALAVHYPELLEDVSAINPDHLRRPENRAVLSALVEAGTIEVAYSRLDGQFAEHLQHLLSRVLPQADRKQRTADWEACLRRLEERHLRELKAQEGVALAQEPVTDGGQTEDEAYIEAVHRQALVTNERLKQLFASSTGAP